MTAHAPPQGAARLAGFLYLVVAAFGIFSEFFVRGGVLVAGDAAVTAANIRAGEFMFRVGYVSDTIVFLVDVAMAVLLYAIFKGAGPVLSLTAGAFRLVMCAVLGFNLLNHYTALLYAGGAPYLDAFTPEQRDALALLSLDKHAHGYELGLMFFGVHCVLLGVLIARSKLVPALFGWGMIAAGVVYLAGGVIDALAAQFAASYETAYVVPVIAEISFALWLLIAGVRGPQGASSSG